MSRARDLADSADLNFDSGTLVVDEANDRVLVGATDSTGTQGRLVHIEKSGAGTNTGIEIQYNRNGSGGPAIDFIKTRGESNGSVTLPVKNDSLGTITWYGGDGNDCLSSAASIVGLADQTPAQDEMGGRIEFRTTANGANSPTKQMELDREGDLKFNSGYGSVATAYGCRAWVNFDGTSTLDVRASGNVSSVQDNGTGDYTIFFSTAMPDADYSTATAGGELFNNGASSIRLPVLDNQTTTKIRLNVRNSANSKVDPEIACVAVFR